MEQTEPDELVEDKRKEKVSYGRPVGGFYRRGITLKQVISHGHQLDTT